MWYIAVLSWWENTEYDISLLSSTSVLIGLEKLGYDIKQYILFQDKKDLFVDLEKGVIDMAFIMIHGKWWEDGQLAHILDSYNIPYQCTSPDVQALTMNKYWTKCLWREQGIPVAQDICIQSTALSYDLLEKDVKERIWFPCVRKELDQGSSKGVHIISTTSELKNIYDIYQSYTGSILIEAFLQWEEITIPLLDMMSWETKTLPLIHIIPPEDGWFDYKNKYNGKTQEICPSWFPQEIIDTVNKLALKAYKALSCSKYARVDGILTKNGPVFLEINTIPWFTDESLFPKSARIFGFAFPQLLQHLIDLSFLKK